jgi:hypothetical protein
VQNSSRRASPHGPGRLHRTTSSFCIIHFHISFLTLSKVHAIPKPLRSSGHARDEEANGNLEPAWRAGAVRDGDVWRRRRGRMLRDPAHRQAVGQCPNRTWIPPLWLSWWGPQEHKPIDLSFEIDLRGRLRRAIESARADLLASGGAAHLGDDAGQRRDDRLRPAPRAQSRIGDLQTQARIPPGLFPAGASAGTIRAHGFRRARDDGGGLDVLRPQGLVAAGPLLILPIFNAFAFFSTFGKREMP